MSDAFVGPNVGQFLYASCSASDYGVVVAVGQDANGQDTIDIEVFDTADLLECPENAGEGGQARHQSWYEVAGAANEFRLPWLVELVVPEGPVVLRHVPWKPASPHPSHDDEPTIVCATPANGCFRCTKLFRLRGEATGLGKRVR